MGRVGGLNLQFVLQHIPPALHIGQAYAFPGVAVAFVMHVCGGMGVPFVFDEARKNRDMMSEENRLFSQRLFTAYLIPLLSSFA